MDALQQIKDCTREANRQADEYVLNLATLRGRALSRGNSMPSLGSQRVSESSPRTRYVEVEHSDDARGNVVAAPVQITADQLELYLHACLIRGHVTQMLTQQFQNIGREKGLTKGVKVKRNTRLVEKTMLRPGSLEGNANKCFDLVRDMYTGHTMQECADVVKMMCEWNDIMVRPRPRKSSLSATRPCMPPPRVVHVGPHVTKSVRARQVIRVKDRYTKPSAGGWRDCMINYVFKQDPHKHICELQVQLFAFWSPPRSS